MWTLYSKDPDHWVPIETIASFKRMREFEPLGVEWVAEALKLSDFLEVDGTKTKVRRKTEVTEPKDQFQRSIYAVRRPVVLNKLISLHLLRKDLGKKPLPCRQNSKNISTNLVV